jgi:putative ABC transport system substrate-binding protein
MRRREFILTVAGAATWPLAARAQQRRTRSIGVLVLGNPDPEPFLRAVRDELRDLGYREGYDARFEVRSASGDAAKLAPLAGDLVANKVDIIIAFQTPAATAAKQATKEIPIVFSAGDPVATGLVDSLARPGGNLTGVSPAGAELGAKNLEIIREVLPSAAKVAVLANANDPFHESFLQHIEDGAAPLNVLIKRVMVRSADELESHFADIAMWRADAVLVQPSIAQPRIADLALQYRVASASHDSSFTRSRGLISYSADLEALYRRCADLVDRVLNGSNPAEVPVELPTKFWLAVNLKTAKALGLDIPPTLLARADEVIE